MGRQGGHVDKDHGDVDGDDEFSSLLVISLEEVGNHTSADSLWVTYKGLVYDVTDFIDDHPGGRELLLTAGGLDLGHFFENYVVHLDNDKASKFLSSMVIGRLSPEDAARARQQTTSEVHTASRLRVLSAARRKLLFVVATLPWWLGVRFVVRILGFVIPPLAHFLAWLLPVSVPGYGGARRLKVPPPHVLPQRIAVIGGGIAGSGCAYSLKESGFQVTLYEARETLGGNARTFDWDNVNGQRVKSCVSVTAWPPTLYKNYAALLRRLDVETTSIPLSWFLNSKVPGHTGFLWAADPDVTPKSLREHFLKDFRRYDSLQRWVRRITNLFTLEFGGEPSMYSLQAGLGFMNPLSFYPLHHLCRLVGISQAWWDIVFTPLYTASFLTDKLDNMSAVTAPMIEMNIPLNPTPNNTRNNRITTCDTWARAGDGILEVFDKLTAGCRVRTNTRVVDVYVDAEGKIIVSDEHGGRGTFDRVVFACPCNAVGNMYKQHGAIAGAILAAPEYADDFHPATGHMHAVMHNDASVIAPEFRQQVLRRASNYVEITRNAEGRLNIENTYNFGVQTPGVNELPQWAKPPMLISHALGDGKVVDPNLIRGTGNHARAHPLYRYVSLRCICNVHVTNASASQLCVCGRLYL